MLCVTTLVFIDPFMNHKTTSTGAAGASLARESALAFGGPQTRERNKWYRHKGAYVMRTGLYVMFCGWLFLGGHALPELLLAQLQTWASRLPS